MKDSLYIGISCGLIKDNNSENRRAAVNIDYIDAVLGGNVIPILLPPNIENEKEIFNLVSIIDGIILSGGDDIDPVFYQEERDGKIGEICRRRDNFEFKVLELSLSRKIPILGICRGLQVINVYFGGSLYQDLSIIGRDILNNHRMEKGSPDHFVDIDKGSWLATIFEEKSIVNSYHHQSIKKLAKGFSVTARSSDGVIEGIEKDGNLFCCGVQWHPEKLFRENIQMKKMFDAFLDLTLKNKSSRSVNPTAM